MEGRHGMRRARRIVAATAVLGMLAGISLSSSALAQDASSSASAEPLTFIIGLTNNVVTFNPLTAIEAPEYEVNGMQYNLLFGFAQEDMSATPEIAAEVPTQENGGLSADGLTWTIKIKPNLKWSDGEPLTANDVAYTYNLILDDNFSAFTSYLPFTDSITAQDDTTLIWKTTKPSIAPLIPPWIYIMPEHFWSKFKDKEAIKKYQGFPDQVTSGPFRVTEWNKDEDWTLEKNPNWWGTEPTIDRVIFKTYSNEETMVQDLEQGAIDFAESIPVNLFRSLQGKEDEGITTNVGGSFSFSQMSFNQCYVQKDCADSTGHPALKDVTVREAVAMAINKDQLVERILGGYGTPGSTIVVPTTPFWHWDPGDATIPWDIDGANALLDSGGYVDSNGDGIRNMPGGGEELNFRFIVRSESPDQIKAGKLITGWLKQIGIGTQTTAVTDAKLIDAWYALDYDLYIWGWGPDPDPDFILSTFTTDQCGSWSDTCFSNEEYDQLYDDQRAATSPEERAGIVKQMQEVVYTEVPEIVLWYDNDLQAWRSDKWTGFELQPTPDANGDGGYALFQYGTYSYENIQPVTGSGAGTASNSGISAGVWIAILAGIAVVVGIVVLVRRRGSDEDKA